MHKFTPTPFVAYTQPLRCTCVMWYWAVYKQCGDGGVVWYSCSKLFWVCGFGGSCLWLIDQCVKFYKVAQQNPLIVRQYIWIALIGCVVKLKMVWLVGPLRNTTQMLVVVTFFRYRELVSNTDRQGSVCTLKVSLFESSHAAQKCLQATHYHDSF